MSQWVGQSHIFCFFLRKEPKTNNFFAMASNLSAIELLNLGDEGRIKPTLNVVWPYALGVSFGVGSACLLNFGTRRPIFSGIQKHIAATAGWTGFLVWLDQKREAYYAERDAVFRHYIQLHPEDFKEPERKKIGDVLEPWIPVR